MISVSRFKKVFLILTAFVCVIAGVSMKAKANYAPMTVIKTPSLNTAMKQGDIIIDNLSDNNIDIKINDTSHFSLKKRCYCRRGGIWSRAIYIQCWRYY